MVREERVNYDLKKSEIEAHLTALQVTSLFLLSPLNVACMFTFDIYLNECHIKNKTIFGFELHDAIIYYNKQFYAEADSIYFTM